MTHTRHSPGPRWDAVLTLLALEARALRRNRMACAVLALAVVAAVSLRLGRDRLAALGRETCYLVYWERDAWVTRLEAAVRNDNLNGLPIRVVHVAELAEDDGTIRYPPGVHSIQLRQRNSANPTAPDRGPTWPVSVGGDGDHSGLPESGLQEQTTCERRWTVWFWHSGNDPAALWPYSQWFWRVTAEHFGDGIEFEPRSSPLRPEAALGDGTLRLTLSAPGGPEWIELGLVWTVVLFTACHLAAQSLAEERTSRTIESVVVTPAGWQGARLAKSLFYGGLAVALGAVVTAVLHAAALRTAAFWFGLGTATLVSLGVGTLAGSRCRTVTAAGAATIVYVAFAGVLFVLAEQLPSGTNAGLGSMLSFERSLLHLWRMAWNAEASAPLAASVPLVLWACVWQAAGARAFQRLRDR